MLIACPSDNGGLTATAPSPTSSPRIAEPRGAISVGVLGEPATLDPYAPLASELTHWLARPLYPSLYRFGEDGRVEPELAGRLETSGDRALITLRPTRWSNGRRISAADVVASVRRARPPSGFARVSSVEARGRGTVEFRGPVGDWQRILATFAPVLPGGRWHPRGPTAGPFHPVRSTPGLRAVYEATPGVVPAPRLRSVAITFTHSLEVMLGLLERGRLDAAVLPMSVNLDDRLDELGLSHSDGPLRESIYLDLEGAAPDLAYRRRLIAAVDVRALHEGFIRDDGRISARPTAGVAQGPDTVVRFAVPGGDELLTLMQRAVQLQMKEHGITAELVSLDPQTFYGSWARVDPVDIAIRRSSLPVREQGDLDTVPLFAVETIVAWRGDLSGVVATSSPDGPFWNLGAWSVSE